MRLKTALPLSSLALSLIAAALFAGELIPVGMTGAWRVWLAFVVLFWLTGVCALGPLVARATGRRGARPAAIAAVTMLALHLTCGPLYYRGVPFRGQVIVLPDEIPAVQAHVTARWILSSYGMEALSSGKTLYETTVVSTGDGSFVIPGWTPRLRPPFTFLYNDPAITASAPGTISFQESGRRFERSDTRHPFSSPRLSQWDGEQLWIYREIDQPVSTRPATNRSGHMSELLKRGGASRGHASPGKAE